MFLCRPPHLQIPPPLTASPALPSARHRPGEVKPEEMDVIFDGEGSKAPQWVERKMLSIQISLAVWLLLFELK